MEVTKPYKFYRVTLDFSPISYYPSFLGPEGLPPLSCRKSDESLRICIGEALDFEGPPKPRINKNRNKNSGRNKSRKQKPPKTLWGSLGP